MGLVSLLSSCTFLFVGTLSFLVLMVLLLQAVRSGSGSGGGRSCFLSIVWKSVSGTESNSL